jgi:hypothetical protein
MPAVIEQPVADSPFGEPLRQFEFGERGSTGRDPQGRRESSRFVPIPHDGYGHPLARSEIEALEGLAAVPPTFGDFDVTDSSGS